jgi:ABC-type phosphate/phosphonate transport system substrate-binding protein
MATSTKAGARPAVASLPMYDWPEVSNVIDRLWEGVAASFRGAGFDAPERLDRRTSFQDVWREPGLLLSQTCGYPYVKELRGKVALVGAPVYDAPGCSGATYRSFLVVRCDDPATAVAMLRDRRAAINGRDSQSGYSALRATVAPFAGGGRFFDTVIVSGAHRASLRAVADGSADVAAIDSVCWAMAQHHEPAAFAKLRVLAQSPIAPSLPFITSLSRDPIERAALLSALRQTIAGDAALFRKELHLIDVADTTDRAYDPIAEIERRAAQLGYADVA